jgi:iron complex outermembrane receptor protein
MIDGRSVYTPLFSGVFWEAQDVLLSDIERIEVISGPGATLWGANAVNGVINIITLPASRTQGLSAYAGGGDAEMGAAVRYGGTTRGGAAWRAYAKHFHRDHQELESGAALRDESERAQLGFRADWEKGAGTFTLQGDAYAATLDQAPAGRAISGANLLARWSGATGPTSSYRVQAYWDHTQREHPGTFEQTLDTLDIEAQHHSRPWAGHRVVVGVGARHSRDRVGNSAAQAFLPANRSLGWGNLFAQDEVRLANNLAVTLGLKAETNPYTDVEWLPNLRLAWALDPTQSIWGALSRAVRAPSRIDREIFVPGNPPYQLVGSDVFESEVANVAEVGWRGQLSPQVSLSATLFHHDYPNLRSLRATAAGLVFANDLEGRNNGIEAWGIWRPSPRWRLSGGFVMQDLEVRSRPGGGNVGGVASLGNDPRRKALLRVSWDARPNLDLDLALRHVGALPSPAVPAYTVADLRVAWRVARSLELSLAMQNAFDRRHAEWGAAGNRAEFGRSAFLRATWVP